MVAASFCDGIFKIRAALVALLLILLIIRNESIQRAGRALGLWLLRRSIFRCCCSFLRASALRRH